MVDAEGPGSVRKCPWVTLVSLRGSIEAERKTSFTLSRCLMGSTKEKSSSSEGIRSLKFEELSDVNISHAVPRRLHSLAFTGSKWVAFAYPVQQTSWLISLKIASPYVATGKNHKLLCSYIPETKNVMVQDAPGRSSYVLNATGKGNGGVSRMSPNSPQQKSSVWGYLCRRSHLGSFLGRPLILSPSINYLV